MKFGVVTFIACANALRMDTADPEIADDWSHSSGDSSHDFRLQVAAYDALTPSPWLARKVQHEIGSANYKNFVEENFKIIFHFFFNFCA